MNTFEMRILDDFHCHPRRGKILETVLRHTACCFRRAVIMPNTDPPILTGADVKQYRREIILASTSYPKFEPLMAVKLVQGYTTPFIIRQAFESGAILGKAYPQGVTHGSQNGIADFSKMYHVFGEMQRIGMILSIHGELPNVFCLDAEKRFLPTLIKIASDFPQLKIVLEHLTTAEAVATIRQLPYNVAATITAHHLFLTLDDVVGNPHNFCKPIAKYEDDRRALIEAAIIGERFFFGSDSAPHLRSKKECAKSAAGIFITVALPLLVQMFQGLGVLEKLEPFTSETGPRFYGLPFNKDKIRLINNPWIVPNEYKCGKDSIVPFMAGKEMSWQVI